MKKITILALLMLGCNLYAQTKSHASKNVDIKYKRVQVIKNSPTVASKLLNAGIDLNCGVVNTDTYIQLELSDFELQGITSLGLKYNVIIDDLTSYYSDRAKVDMPLAQKNLSSEKLKKKTSKSASIKSVVIGNIGQHNDCSEIDFVTPTNFTIPTTFGGCFTYTGVMAELDKMRQLYPNLISVKANISPSNQKTTENRPIYYVKISKNPDVNENEPQALYTGMTHSREVSSLMNNVFYMWYLLENYNTDPFIKNIVDNMELYFIPVVNPDGLTFNETTAPDGGGMQRKNRRVTNGSCTTYLEGVDINRNFGYYYGLNTGSSSTICNDTYRGTSSFSEPETQMVRDFVLTKNFKTALNHHAYSNLLPHPVNGNATTVVTGREDEYAKFCHDMTQYNRYVYGPAPGILYSASGDASDWMNGGAADNNGTTGSGKNIMSVSPENGSLAEGGFWTTPSKITDVAKRALRMNLISAYYAGKYAKLHDMTQSNITSLNTNLTFGIERLGQTDANFTLTVTPVSSNIISISSPTTQSGLTILEQRTVTAGLVLSSSTIANQKIEYKVSLSNGNYVLYEANIIKYYNPTALFNNNPDVDLLSKWTATGTAWVNATSAFTGTKSITDGVGSYSNGLDETTTAKSKILTTTTASNLSGASKILIQYYAKWDLERNYDLVEIQGSVNGTSGWTALCGNYTKPTATTDTNPHASKTATEDAFQNSAGGGGVLYDGDTMDKWVMEEIVIDESNNSFLVGATAAKFRFRLKSDTSNRTDGYNTTFDGFYFDDFKILKIVELSSAPVANCKNATLSLDSNGSLTVLASDINNGSTDDVAITSMTVSPSSFNCSKVNTTQVVTLTVTDADGQSSSCSANVTIKDSTAPVTPTIANATGQCSVTPTAPTTTDNCAGTITGTSNKTFPITTQGTTVVTWTFSDGNGNSVTANQNVIITDTTVPVCVTKDITITINGGETQTITANDIDNGSTDNCGINTKTLSKYSFTSADAGINTITFTATDFKGNTASKTAKVTVVYNTLGTTLPSSTKFVLYPNPFSTYLTINLPTTYLANVLYVQLYDLNGRLVYNKKQTVNGLSVNLVDISTLKDGTYVINLLDSNKKIIQQNQIIKKVAL